MAEMHLVLCSGCCGASTEAPLPHTPAQVLGVLVADASLLSLSLALPDWGKCATQGDRHSQYPMTTRLMVVVRGVIKARGGTLESLRFFCVYIAVQPLCLFLLLSSLLHSPGPRARKSQSVKVFLGIITMFPVTALSCLMYKSHPRARWVKMNWSP